MASFNNPQAGNSILLDLKEVRSLINSLATMNPASGNHTDIPEGAIQLVPVNKNMQFNQFVSGSWKQLTVRFNIDVEKVGGYKPSTTAVKGTLPVYNSQSKLPGSITGNAETASKLETARTIDLAGYISGTAVKFDGSKDISLEVTRIDVNNENDDVLNGKVSIKHGGTGRDDGAAADVIVSSLAGQVKASEYGQIGNAKSATGVDLNSLVVSGNYIASSAAGSYDLHYPSLQSGWTLIRVDRTSNVVKQTVYQGAYLIWVRYSDDSGASWKAWQPIGGSFANSYSIYISKSGSDTNTGLNKEYPVLTISRALHIAATLVPTVSNSYVNFYIGEGDWGDVTFSTLPYNLRIYPYSGTASEYSDSLPKFGTLTSYHSFVSVYGVNADVLDANGHGFLGINSYNRCAMIMARYSGVAYIVTHSTIPIEIRSMSSHDAVISSYGGGMILVDSKRTIKIVENLNLIAFFNCGSDAYGLSYLSFLLDEGISVTGKRYAISNYAYVGTSKSFLDELPGSINGTITGGVSIGGLPYGGGATDEALMADLSWKPVLLQTGGELSGDLRINKLSPRFVAQLTNVVKGETPNTDQWARLDFMASGADLTSNRVGIVQTKVSKDAYVVSQLVALKNEANSNASASLEVYYKDDGTTYAQAPTPPDSATGKEIVTAAWYNEKIAAYMPKTGGTFTGAVKGQTVTASSNSTDFATTAWVRAATGNTNLKAANSTKWNGAGKTVSTAMPSGGNDGDIWFRY